MWPRHRRDRVLWLLAGVILLVVPHAVADSGLQARLDEIAIVNRAQPWPASSALLDEIEPLLATATPRQYAQFMLLRARTLMLSGDHESGMRLLDDLLERSLDADQRLHALELNTNVATLARAHERAFDYLKQGLSLEPGVDDPERQTGILSIASYMYAQVGELERALEYGHRSLERATRTGLIRETCVARQRLAAAYKTGSDDATSEFHYRAALEACEAAGDRLFVGALQHGLGDLLRRTGRYDEAEAYINQSLVKLEEEGFAVGIAEARLARARLDFDRGDWASAQPRLMSLVPVLESLDTWDHVADVYRMLAAIAEQHGALDEALAHQRARFKAHQRFLDRDRAMRVAYLEVEFDSQYKEQELSLLREQARAGRLEEQTRRQQRNLRSLGMVTVVFVLVALVLLLIHLTRERRHYRRLSQCDSLTGLYNHTSFFETAEQRLADARERGRSLVLVLADIDFFKQVNDEHGHLIGDTVLQSVAGRIRRVFGGSEIVGRIGGEEFAMIVEGGGLDDTVARIDQLRQALRDIGPDEGPPVTMSFGIAELTAEASLTGWRRRADEALYRAKRGGRDRIIIAQQPPGAGRAAVAPA